MVKNKNNLLRLDIWKISSKSSNNKIKNENNWILIKVRNWQLILKSNIQISIYLIRSMQIKRKLKNINNKQNNIRGFKVDQVVTRSKQL